MHYAFTPARRALVTGVPKTISKGRIFSCTVEVPDKIVAAMKGAKDVAAQNIQAGADYWHSKILPDHFKSGAAGVYGYAQRSITYLKQRGKSGKPYLVFSGSLRRDVTARAAFKQQAGGGVELRMQARVLNLVPNMAQDDPSPTVKHKKGGIYPNLKREIKLMTEDEREAVAQVIVTGLELAFDTTAAVQRGLTEGSAGSMRDAIDSFFD